MRETKEYDERRKEIIENAMKLFVRQGYGKTTINDILREVKIAKGTFYYYFSSKEEVLDAIIEDVTNIAVKRVEAIIERTDLMSSEKLVEGILALNVQESDNEGILEELHDSENSLMHQKSLNQLVTHIAPLIAKIVEEGYKNGEFGKGLSEEIVEFILASAVMITDQGIFNYTPEKQLKMKKCIIDLVEVLLDVKQGTFLTIIQKKMKK